MKRRLLICDLDNTLYDWVGFFVPSFYALVDEVVRLTGCNREELLDDFKEVHQRHHDSEFPFAALETKLVQSRFPNKDRSELAKILDPAFHAFNSRRKDTLRLYPNVRETLERLTKADVSIVAHTESNLYAAVGRLTRLNIIDYFNRIYCRERSPLTHPNPKSAATWATTINSHRIKELSHHQRKPNVEVLLEICRDEEFAPAEVAYVGDSLARDISMAHEAGVFSIWAKYGVSHSSKDYEKLVRVTHWTSDDVARERALSERVRTLKPDMTLEYNFGEILPVFVNTEAYNLGRLTGLKAQS